ncbi:MAG TPA: hypothetical protein VFG04_12805 [Planctomycetaceae bacterium]|jgi:hypothetical protein|nr:hypothetical protein [Planctomycetaceae bacterium]
MIHRTHLVFPVFALLAVALGGVAGCGNQSNKRTVDQVLKESGQSRADVAPLAGRVTVDGQVPDVGGFGRPKLVILLFDQSKLDAKPDVVPKATVDAKGEFAFSTYDQGDGVAPGKYVMVLLSKKFDKKKGYFGPDLLKNLYNDPNENLKVADLKIDHQAPGKKDLTIDLKLAGRDAGTPGPKAVTVLK